MVLNKQRCRGKQEVKRGAGKKTPVGLADIFTHLFIQERLCHWPGTTASQSEKPRRKFQDSKASSPHMISNGCVMMVQLFVCLN